MEGGELRAVARLVRERETHGAPCFESTSFSFFVGPGDGGSKNGAMVDSNFSDTIRAFITENAFVTWDPDESKGFKVRMLLT